jgi:hypothetical protein
MAINRAALPQQLEAGAPDLRLTGDQRDRGTYTQRRRDQMAYGGIAGLDGRKRYGIGSWFQEKIKDPIKEKIVDPIMQNKGIAALTGGALLNQFGLPDLIPGAGTSKGMGKNWLGELLGKDLVYGPGGEQSVGRKWDINDPMAPVIAGVNTASDLSPWRKALATVLPGGDPGYVEGGLYNQILGLGGSGGSGGSNAYNADGTPNINWKGPLAIGTAAGLAQQAYLDKQPPFPMDETGIDFQTAQQAMDDPNLRFKPPLEATQLAADGGRIGFSNGTPGLGLVPENQGLMAGIGAALPPEKSEYLTKKSDTNDVDTMNRIYQEQGNEGLDAYIKRNPHLNDKYVNIYLDPFGNDDDGHIVAVPNELYNMEKETMGVDGGNIMITVPENRAQGGRIGYKGGSGSYSEYAQAMNALGMEPMPIQIFQSLEGTMSVQEMVNMGSPGKAQGGRIGAQEGGLMDLGGMEKDYRQEGGFVPLGGEEKADDVPARLSKNEFVFTADAVRNAGGGDIDAGAEIMENLMENLEAGGEVSEDSQGLEGAREMFANAQELQKRII